MIPARFTFSGPPVLISKIGANPWPVPLHLVQRKFAIKPYLKKSENRKKTAHLHSFFKKYEFNFKSNSYISEKTNVVFCLRTCNTGLYFCSQLSCNCDSPPPPPPPKKRKKRKGTKTAFCQSYDIDRSRLKELKEYINCVLCTAHKFN